jgi:SAM-dependent methyltransferase
MLGDPLVFDRWRWLHRAGRRGVRTLDAGCGSGWFAIYMAGHGNEVVGINFDGKAVAAATRRAQARGIEHASFIEADLRKLDALAPELGTFDQIICFETIEHIKDDHKLVRDLASMLNPGGRLMLTTPSSERPPLVGEKWSDVEDGGHVRFGYTHAELAAVCEAAGLRVVERGRLGGFVVQKLYNAALRMVPRFGAHVAILLSLALRPLQVLDGPLTKLLNYPQLCISMMAERPAGTG